MNDYEIKRSVKRNLLAFAGIFIIFLLSANNTGESGGLITKNPIYLNISFSFEERAADLVSRLTLEEKESLLWARIILPE